MRFSLLSGWSDCHLNRFRIHGFDENANRIRLADVHPDDCGWVWAFQQRRDEAPWRAQELLDEIAECLRDRDISSLRHLAEEIHAIQT